MTTKPKPTYLSTADNAALLKLIDLAFDLATQLDREHAAQLATLLQAMRATMPDNPRSFASKGDVDELLAARQTRDMGVHTVNRKLRDQGKPALRNIQRRTPDPDRPTLADVGRLESLLRSYLAGDAVAIDDAPSEPEPPITLRALDALDSALLAAELDQWLADGPEIDEEDDE